ncbi:MAG: hypothetical protein ACR2L3_01715 [Actinomycetota bacterium]
MGEGTEWFIGRIPDDWFSGAPEVEFDRDEILVVGALEDVALEGDADTAALDDAREGRVKRFREETREVRMKIAREAERRFGRKVAWGVKIGGERYVFTSLAVPVMTRLRLSERRTLDTLVQAGVARSRSEALAWCVKLVAKNEEAWIGDLREAMVAVDKLRAEGPRAS